MKRKGRRMSDQSEGTASPSATTRTEKEHLAKLSDLDLQPSPNPRYRGMTRGDAARAMMRPRQVTRPSPSKEQGK